MGNIFLKYILTQIFRDQFLTVVHDENSAYIELNVIFLLPVFKQIKGCTPGDEEESSEFQLPFHREVLQTSKASFDQLGQLSLQYCLAVLEMQKADSKLLEISGKTQ